MCARGFLLITQVCAAVGGTTAPSPVGLAMDVFGLFSTSGRPLGSFRFVLTPSDLPPPVWSTSSFLEPQGAPQSS